MEVRLWTLAIAAVYRQAEVVGKARSLICRRPLSDLIGAAPQFIEEGSL